MSQSFSAYLINLDRDTERLSFMHEQLTRLGIAYERISALRGTDTEALEAYDAGSAITSGYALSDGEIGCAASHRRAYELMLKHDAKYALILEDDVELPKDFSDIIEREIARNTGTWEYLLFDYWEPGKIAQSLWCHSAHIAVKTGFSQGFWRGILSAALVLLKGLYVIPLLVFEEWRNSYKKTHPGPVRFLRPLYLAGAYLVTAEGANKLYSLATPIRYTADRLPNQARIQKGLNFKAYAPLCVRQLKRHFGSSILEMNGNELIP